jgi:hypothetical protein
MQEKSFVIIFGSAPAFVKDREGNPRPNDLDVAVGGNFSQEDAKEAAREWAQKHNLDAMLPVDCHRFHVREGESLRLPTPWGKWAYWEVLRGRGEISVEPFRVTNLPAFLRLAELDPAAALREVFTRAGSRQVVNNLAIGLTSEKGEGYSGEGPEALANALRHPPEVFFDNLGELGRLLKRIRDLGQEWPKRIRPEAEAKARAKSSGKFGRYFLHFDEEGWTARLAHEVPPRKITLQELWEEVVSQD